jgi:hypothetical protein
MERRAVPLAISAPQSLRGADALDPSRIPAVSGCPHGPALGRGINDPPLIDLDSCAFISLCVRYAVLGRLGQPLASDGRCGGAESATDRNTHAYTGAAE